MEDAGNLLLRAAACVLAAAAVGLLATGAGRVWSQRAGPKGAAAKSSLAGRVLGVAQGVGTVLPRSVRSRLAVRFERLLLHAGLAGRVRVDETLGLVLLLGAAGLVGGVTLHFALGLPAAGAVGVSLLCAWSPYAVLKERVAARQRQVSRALPFYLDLLVLAVEGGLDFTAALARVAERSKPGPLKDEVLQALGELRVGKTRREVLDGMGRRVGLPALSALVAALVQSDRLGTPVGKVLRLQAMELRTQRTLLAEKLAAEAPVRMLVPLVGCFFPAVFLALFGPIVFFLLYGQGAR